MKDHGGDIYAQSRKQGLSPARIVDFSASINPLGMPRTALAEIQRQMQLVPHYPEPYCESLSSVIARHYRVSSASVLCGNGSTELIYLIPKVLVPKRILVTAPAFSEYQKACEMNGTIQVHHLALNPEDDLTIDTNKFIHAMQGKNTACDIAFLCNPNNPTGRLMKKRDILKIADAAWEMKSYLVVDEAFIDFCPGESVIASVARNPYLTVLRSMTKFYALAGLRLGFGVFPRELAERLKSRKEPWSVNSLAAAAGSVVLSDTAYRDASHALILREKRFLEKRFEDLGIKYVPSDANYYLLYLKNAGAAVKSLAKRGILIRDCSNFKGLCRGYVRIAVRSRKENALLMRELEKICRQS